MTPFIYEMFNARGHESDYLAKQLRAFNAKAVGEYTEPIPIGFVVREKDRIIAGAFGWLRWGWLYLDLAWVDESVPGVR